MITLKEYYKKRDDLYNEAPEELWDFEASVLERRKWVAKNITPKIKKLQTQLSEEDLRTLIMSELRFFDRMNSEAGVEEEMDFEKEFEKIKKDLEKYKD